MAGTTQDLPPGFSMAPEQARAGAPGGPLAGLRFATKESMDIAGTRTMPGNPDYAEAHVPAADDAAAVRRALQAGAQWVGKTHMHEMAYGITGVNPHTGTPDNPRLPGHVPGGSSSGSAVAVAAGAVDFALGSDTAGSLRVPASYCGVWSLRPTHGRVPGEGMVALAPSLDVAGALAGSAEVLRRATLALLDPAPGDAPPSGVPPVDALPAGSPLADAPRAGAVAPVLKRVAVFRHMPEMGEAARVALQAVAAALEGLGLAPAALDWSDWDDALAAQRTVQYAEFLGEHQPWLDERRPRLGADVADHVAQARALSVAQIGHAISARARHALAIRRLVAGGTVLVVPAAPAGPPSVAALADVEAARRHRTAVLKFNCLAGVAGLPVLCVPAGTAAEPIGIQVIGAPGSDEQLLELGVRLRL